MRIILRLIGEPMNEPKTAKQHNAPLTGEYIATTSGSETMASGYAYDLFIQRQLEEKRKISETLKRFIQNEIIVQQATAEIHKALFGV
jgi:hypothetical protein